MFLIIILTTFIFNNESKNDFFTVYNILSLYGIFEFGFSFLILSLTSSKNKMMNILKV